MYNNNSGSMFAKLEGSKGYSNTYDSHTVNPYFNWTKAANEQQLQDILVAESIQSRGVEVFYIRRDMNPDLVYGEDPLSKFKKHYKVSVYVESFEAYEGDGDWYSKFDFQINDDLNVITNDNLFRLQGDGNQARMGDLVYFPQAKSLFEISWVEKDDPLFPLGSRPSRKLKLDKFVYSGEEISLENEDYIDNIDSLDDMDKLFDEDNDNPSDVDIINNLDGRWDIHNEQGAEIDFINSEAEKFHVSHQQAPNAADPISDNDNRSLPPMRKSGE